MNPYHGSDSGPVVSLLLGVTLVLVAFALLIALGVYVLNGFAFMRLYRKVGVEPWAAWVPYFNYWRLFELGGQVGWLSLLGLIPSIGGILRLVFRGIALYRIGISFRKHGGYVVLGIFLPFVWAFVLGADQESYEPDLVRSHGYGPPLAGYGSSRGPYMPGPWSGAPGA